MIIRLLGNRLVVTILALFAACAVLALAFPDEGEPELSRFGKANEAFNTGDWDTANRLLLPMAIDGDALAQEYMAYLEAFGFGRVISRENARDWAARAGARRMRGSMECQLSGIWANGQFGRMDAEETVFWARHADMLRGNNFCSERLREGMADSKDRDMIVELLEKDN